MNRTILISIFTLSALVLPGFAAAVEESAVQLTVLTASHSSNVNADEPLPEDEKECAQHLAELVGEGMAINETTTGNSGAEKLAAIGGYIAVFHLSNNSSRRPKAAIIVCGKSVENPNPEER